MNISEELENKAVHELRSDMKVIGLGMRATEGMEYLRAMHDMQMILQCLIFSTLEDRSMFMEALESG
ncbi:hypothetical protein I7I48_06208 [Histoplasma ohiense]|nr:hypothetical protein I7I48_06208 [Histoplasma ohiense (nom. inval.)]